MFSFFTFLNDRVLDSSIYFKFIESDMLVSFGTAMFNGYNKNS